ncbi:MAG: anti-sigma factor antagonist [Agathobacter sp.]|nr:anti-sigma factor antagonist [Agathobacter sp.]
MVKRYFITGDEMIYRMPKELDHHMARQMSVEIDGLIDTMNIRNIIFDFKETSFMDSSGIGVIIGRCKKIHYLNGNIAAVNISNRIEKVFRAAGLYKIINVEECVNGEE